MYDYVYISMFIYVRWCMYVCARAYVCVCFLCSSISIEDERLKKKFDNQVVSIKKKINIVQSDLPNCNNYNYTTA